MADDEDKLLDELLGDEKEAVAPIVMPAKKGRPAGTPIDLSPKHLKFIEAYVATSNMKMAATIAGFSPTNASHLIKQPAIKKALDAIREKSLIVSSWNLEKAMIEADQGIAFARETGNANAFAKFSELKAKYNGLLIDRMDVRQANFEINVLGLGTKEDDTDQDG
jgi:hypothetical protein